MKSRFSWASALPVVFALAGALLALNLVSAAFGEAPLGTLARIWEGTWGSAYGVGQVLFKATPLLLTGLAFHVALRAGLFNIGAEGQLALGSLAAGFVASKLPAGTPWLLALPLALGAALVVGAAWAAIAGALRARRDVHEVISTIMLNRIADVLVPWAVAGYLGSSSLRTGDIVPGAQLPKFEGLIPALTGSALSAAFPLAVLATYGAYAWLERSRAGREMRWVGQNPEACRAEGIDVRGRIFLAMVLSGALAAAAAAGTVLGYKGYYELGLGAGTGFAGIAVAMLGARSATGLVASAILFGTLEQAGLAINARVPKEAMSVLEALVIVLVAVAAHRSRAGERAAEGAAR
jgi:ABC-type uncharacterized transport system permease subunit